MEALYMGHNEREEGSVVKDNLAQVLQQSRES